MPCTVQVSCHCLNLHHVDLGSKYPLEHLLHLDQKPLHTLVKSCSVVSVLDLHSWLVNYYENVNMQEKKKHSNCKTVKEQWKKNTCSFYCQDLIVCSGLRVADEEIFFQISHDLHWPLVSFALLQKHC